MKKKIFAMIILGCLLGVSGCKKETDLDKMLGNWGLEDKFWVITFYEPDDDNRTSGDIQIIDEEETTTGTYEWHEANQRIVLTAIDNWGAEVQISYDYELIDEDTLYLTLTDSDREPMKFTRIKD